MNITKPSLMEMASVDFFFTQYQSFARSWAEVTTELHVRHYGCRCWRYLCLDKGVRVVRHVQDYFCTSLSHTSRPGIDIPVKLGPRKKMDWGRSKTWC